jgi:hypothetical protein
VIASWARILTNRAIVLAIWTTLAHNPPHFNIAAMNKIPLKTASIARVRTIIPPVRLGVSKISLLCETQ